MNRFPSPAAFATILVPDTARGSVAQPAVRGSS